jgi:hypothetical protein
MLIKARQFIGDFYEKEFIFIEKWEDGYAVLMRETMYKAIILFDRLSEDAANDMELRIYDALNLFFNK